MEFDNTQHMVRQGMEKAGTRTLDLAARHIQRSAAAPLAQGKDAIRAAAEEFEAVFISQMLGHMFAGEETNPLFGGGFAEDIYKSMMVDEYGKLMSKNGGIGVADHVVRQLMGQQENNPESTLTMMHHAREAYKTTQSGQE